MKNKIMRASYKGKYQCELKQLRIRYLHNGPKEIFTVEIIQFGDEVEDLLETFTDGNTYNKYEKALNRYKELKNKRGYTQEEKLIEFDEIFNNKRIENYTEVEG